MRGWLMVALALSGLAGADPLLDRTRASYQGLKTYQARIHCRLYKGLPQGQPFVDTITQVSAHLPSQLRLQAQMVRDGRRVPILHVFDGTWQWVESAAKRQKLKLARVLEPGGPFATGVNLPSGLIDGQDLVGTVISVLDEGGLEKSPGTRQLGKYACRIYALKGQRYGGDNRVELYLDEQGWLRGYQERDWDDDGTEKTAVVTIEDFQPGPAVAASAFRVAAPATFPDKTAEHLSECKKEQRATDEADLQRLARCLTAGDLRNARRLTKKRPELLKVRFSSEGFTPLQLAAGKPEMVEWLLQQKCDPVLPDRLGRCGVNAATSLQEWQLYAAHGVDFQALQARCQCLLLDAFGVASPDMVRFLQARGITGPLIAPAQYPLGAGVSVLHLAARSPQPEVLVALALELGAPAQTPDVLPLLLANPASGRLQAIRLLQAKGMDLDAADAQSTSALMRAVQREDLELVTTLLQCGAHPNRLQGGASAMHDAAVAGEPELLRKLLAAQGDPNLAGELAWTPLHAAVYWGHEQHVQILLEAGADPKKPDEHGNTPLHVAASFGHTALYQRLLAAGAQPGLLNQAGQTAEQLSR